ncbi:MAG: mechanosensitive ion channel family protein [Gammaproteobacteria bacterium]
MKKVYLWIIIVIAMGSSSFCVAQEVHALTTAPTMATTVSPQEMPSQTTVDDLSNSLNTIAQQLQQVAALDMKALNALQNNLEKTMSQIKTVEKLAQTVSESYGAQLKALGAAPKKGAPPEDSHTAERRKALESAFAQYAGLASQAKASYVRAESLLRTLTEVRFTIRNRHLFKRGEPVFSLAVWANATHQLMHVMDATAQSIDYIASQFFKAMSHWPHLIVFLFVSLSSFVLMGPVARRLQKKYGERHPHVVPSLFRRLFTAFITMITHGILPLSSLLLLVFTLHTMDVFTSVQYTTIVQGVLVMGFLLVVLSLIHLLLSAKKPSWRVFDLSNASARALDRRVAPFSFFIALNAYMAFLVRQHLLGHELYTVILLFLRTTTCGLGLLLMQPHCWLPREKTALINARSHVHPQMHQWFLKILYVIAMVVFITNPFMVLFGYSALSDALFSAFIRTGAIILLAFTLHLYMRESFARLLGVKGKKEGWFSEQLGLSESSRRIISYWMLVILDSFVLLGAFVLIALNWGIDRVYLFSLLKALFFGIDFGKNHVSLISFFIAIVTFLILFYLTRFSQRVLTEKVFPYTNLEQGAQHALKIGLGYIGFALSLIIAISVFGIDLSSLAMIVGALSVGIGFGLQSAVGNFVAGIIMLIERPIKIGDRIVVGDVEGIVRRISVRATELETFDQSSILVPNSDLINGRVRNWTFRNELNRVDIPIRVAYETDPQTVKAILIKAALNNEAIVDDPEPQVLFKDFAESSKNFMLQVFLKDISKRNRIDSELRYAIDSLFKEAGIIIPYPHYDIHLKKEEDE